MRTVVDEAAERAHEAHRAFCVLHGVDDVPRWRDTAIEYRDRFRMAAQAIADRPDLTLRERHDTGVAAMVEDGWVYGPERDAAAKTSPDIVEYAELPAGQIVADILFAATVRATLAMRWQQ